MNAQRALKNYALIGMGVNSYNPQADLKKSLEDIDGSFKYFKTSKLGEKLTADILELETLWSAIKPMFQKESFDKITMHELHEKIDEDYTDRCEGSVNNIAVDTGIKGEHYVFLLAQLGMESQRLAAMYLFKTWGIDDPHYDTVITHALDEINNIYKVLMSAEGNLLSQEIKDRLKNTEKDFIAFGVIARSKTGRFMPAKAAVISTKIFDILQEILHMERA